jgi:hypothetical protein
MYSMKVLRLIAFSVALAMAGSVSAQDLVTPSDRVTTHVNIRAAADENAPKIGDLELHAALPLVATRCECSSLA